MDAESGEAEASGQHLDFQRTRFVVEHGCHGNFRRLSISRSNASGVTLWWKS